MIVYLLVGLGGACGSLARYILGIKITRKSPHTFPLSTLIINVSGAFLLGFVNNINLGSPLLLFLADGFLGAYTTFSTFMYEGFSLFHDNKRLNTVIYIISTVLSGIIFFILGRLLARLLTQ